MTEAPEEIHIKPNRDYTSIWGRPVVTDPFDDDPETAGYIRLDAHEAAVAAARKEGMLAAAAHLHWMWDADGTVTERRVAEESQRSIIAEASK